MVLADSIRISRVPTYLGKKLSNNLYFGYRTFTLYGPTFQMGSPIKIIQMSLIPLPHTMNCTV